MGFFRNIRNAMNEEFVIGRENVLQYEAEPECLQETQREERARGGGVLDGVGQAVFIAGAALLVAHAWQEGRDRSD